ncbi:MAG TPA: DUF4863 family protein [Burkholderiaceae bacterium]|nr:DUF4863 family protein [Burkholderiaceae bacterium]
MEGIETFQRLITQVTDHIGDRPLDAALQEHLRHNVPYDGELCQAIFQACRQGIAEGWMCQHEHGGIRYGRVLKPTDDRGGYSVDVVDMDDIAGPHHRHPDGEIDLIMPLDGTAQFDGHSAGWLVYGPDTAHSPTVTSGRALVLYLLPQGQIEFTRR